jgi:hypothetical protein
MFRTRNQLIGRRRGEAMFAGLVENSATFLVKATYM